VCVCVCVGVCVCVCVCVCVWNGVLMLCLFTVISKVNTATVQAR